MKKGEEIKISKDIQINFNQISIHLIEECSELIFILSKARRFGILNYHPQDERKITNLENIGKECNDVKKE